MPVTEQALPNRKVEQPVKAGRRHETDQEPAAKTETIRRSPQIFQAFSRLGCCATMTEENRRHARCGDGCVPASDIGRHYLPDCESSYGRGSRCCVGVNCAAASDDRGDDGETASGIPIIRCGDCEYRDITRYSPSLSGRPPMTVVAHYRPKNRLVASPARRPPPATFSAARTPIGLLAVFSEHLLLFRTDTPAKILGGALSPGHRRRQNDQARTLHPAVTRDDDGRTGITRTSPYRELAAPTALTGGSLTVACRSGGTRHGRLHPDIGACGYLEEQYGRAISGR